MLVDTGTLVGAGDAGRYRCLCDRRLQGQSGVSSVGQTVCCSLSNAQVLGETRRWFRFSWLDAFLLSQTGTDSTDMVM